MEAVNHFYKSMENGTTRPSLVNATNDVIYVLKTINEDASAKVLLNELVGFRLGRLLEIPMPNLVFLELSHELIEKTDFYRDIGAKPGIGLGSEYVKGNAKVNPVVLKNVENLEDIPKIILFDQVVMNNDRAENDGNLYFEKKTKKILAIDHSHIFASSIWTASDINRLHSSIPNIVKNIEGPIYKYCSPYIKGNSPFYYGREKYKNIGESEINSLFSDIPIEWEISNEEIESLKKFISEQINQIDDLLEKLKPYFKNWKGSN